MLLVIFDPEIAMLHKYVVPDDFIDPDFVQDYGPDATRELVYNFIEENTPYDPLTCPSFLVFTLTEVEDRSYINTKPLC